MVLNVKVCLSNNNNDQEIRRFKMDGVVLFETLLSAIEQFFPIPREKIFKLLWRGKFNLICVMSWLKSKILHNSRDCYITRFL